MSSPTTWLETIPAQKVYPQLKGEIKTDVVIVGAGITSILTAYRLSKLGKKVVIFDKGKICKNGTAYTTAFLTKIIDSNLTDLVTMFGTQKAKMVWQSGQQAIEEIEQIVKIESIDCEFMRSSINVYASDETEFNKLANELTTIKDLGFEANLKKDDSLGFENYGYLEIPNQAKFHPLKFTSALADIIVKAGVQIFEKSEAVKIEGSTVYTEHGSVTATDIIVATQIPFNKPSVLRFKKATYQSYVFEVKIPKGLLPESMFIDSKNPYHYFRVDSLLDHDRLIIGGEDHRKDIPVSINKSYAALKEFTKNLLPEAKIKITLKWEGYLYESVDGLPFIGQYEENKYLASAFSGNGFTYAIITAIMMEDLISGKKNIWSKIYDPKRSLSIMPMLFKGRDYMMTFFNAAVRNTFKY